MHIHMPSRAQLCCSLVAVLSFVAVPLAVQPAAQAAQVPPGLIRILESSPGSLTLELVTPGLAPRERRQAGRDCVELAAPGLATLARAGQPLAPTAGAVLAVPALSGLRLEVIDATGQPLPARVLCTAEPLEPLGDGSLVAEPGSAPSAQEPVSASRAEGFEPWIAASPEAGRLRPDALYPGPLAEIGFSGVLRGQMVAQVQFYPLQVDEAHNQLLFFPRLRVRLAFDAAAPERPARSAGGPFEPLLHQVLLNAPAPVAPHTQVAGTTPQQAIPPGLARAPDDLPALKVFVDATGMVQITPADLAAAGWDIAALDPRTLQVSNQGVEQHIWVEGQEDGRLDPDDFLLFYGQGLAGPYTRRNVYWLTAGGAAGLRMALRDAAPTHGYPTAASFRATLHAEQDTAAGYWQNPPGREAQDHWYWTGKLSAPTSAGLAFDMPPFDPAAGPVALRVQLAGRTDSLAVNPDHHTRLLLGGVPVHEAWWDGQIEFRHTTTVAATLLTTGTNTLTVQLVGDTGASVDSLYANWLEIDYQALYTSQNDVLGFRAPAAGDYQFRLSNFSSDEVEVFDVSNPAQPVRLAGIESQSGGGAFTAVFEDNASTATRYLALTPAQRQAPAGLEADQPSNLQDPANGADEIIIAYDAFYADVLPLAAHRQARGLRVQVVRVSDVYDEFGGGVFSPQALRDFLTYAYHHWTPPAPSYVLLVGDAHLDFLNRFGTGAPNFVPTHIFDAFGVGETANDTWFACVDGADPLPDLFLGRLSARTSADVQVMVSKIIQYETSPPSGSWTSQALYVADDDTTLFETVSEGWIAQLPASYRPSRVYAADYPPGNPQTDIVSTINAGAGLITYNGHGNQDRWGSWSGGTLFTTSTVGQLTNGGRLPFVATATCLNGFFPNPLVAYCLAEEFARRTGGGAIGVWSPSALGFTSEHDILFSELFDAMFGTNHPTLGSITTQAKLAGYGQGVSQEAMETYTLFGDPAVRLAGLNTCPRSPDVDGSGQVTVLDVTAVAERWRNPAQYVNTCDIDCSGAIDIMDIEWVATAFDESE